MPVIAVVRRTRAQFCARTAFAQRALPRLIPAWPTGAFQQAPVAARRQTPP